MADNYKFILDEKVLSDFVAWLPELEDGECYMVVCLARNKYVRDLENMKEIKIPSDKQQIARFLSSKKDFVNRIRELECALGTYKIRRTGDPIPQEAVAVYVSVNPRSYVLGAKNSLKLIADLITKPYNGYRLDQEVISCIQGSPGHKHFMDIDFDGADLEATLTEAKKVINSNCLSVIKTRGGFHLLVKVTEIDPRYKKSWYNQLVKLAGADVHGDNLIPIPGCSQGMFMPVLITNIG